jgi:hypothetical protein
MTTETAFALVVYVVVFGSPVWVPIAIYIYHQRKNPPVTIMSLEELTKAGFSQKEAIVEQRRQRAEARDHVRTSTNAIRASVRAGRIAKSIVKKLK